MRQTALALLLIFLLPSARALSDEQLRILTTREPPANFMENGEVTGTTTDIVRGILNILGEEIEIELMPWARAYTIAKNVPNIVIYTAGRTQERIDLGFHFLGPVISRKHSLWKRRNVPIQISSIDDILTNRALVSGMRQDWREEFFSSQGVHVVRTADNRLGLKQLIQGRVQLWIASDIEAPTIAREAGISLQEIEIAYVFKEAPSFIMISNGTPKPTVDRWRQAFETLNDGDFYDRTARKWSRRLGLNLRHSQERGFHIEQP